MLRGHSFILTITQWQCIAPASDEVILSFVQHVFEMPKVTSVKMESKYCSTYFHFLLDMINHLLLVCGTPGEEEKGNR